MDTLFSGQYCLHKLVYLAFFFFFFSPISGLYNNFEVILAAREEEYKKQFVK